MSTALALRLISSGAVSAADAEAALITSLARRVPFVRALIDTGAVGEAVLDSFLEQLGGIGLRQVSGMPELVNRLPPHFCRRMGVLPVRVDHTARIVEVAAADPLDPHIAAEVAFHLGVPARVLRAPIAAIEEAIRRIELEAEAAAGRARRATPPFPHGAPESSNPPPPPPEPAPIPLLKRSGERSPDTLRLYKQTLRPGEKQTDLDYGDPASGAQDRAPDGMTLPPDSLPIPLAHAKGWDADAAEDSAPPKTLRDSGRLRDIANQPSGQPRTTGDSGRLRDIASQITVEPSRSARDSTPNLRELGRQVGADSGRTPRDSVLNLRELGRQVSGEAGRTVRDSVADLRELGRRASGDTARPPLKDSVPNLRELAEQLTNEPVPKTLRDSGRLRDIAQQASSREPPPRSARDSTRLRDIVDPPPAMDRLRDSTRLRDLAAAVPREGAPSPDGADGPLSSIVPADQAPPPGEPPAVSFPSMPPPSILEQPALLAADTEWTGPMPSAEQKPDAPSRKERKPSRFARPAIDIQIPQPPSENRARRQRSTWDVQYGAGEAQDDPSPEPPRAVEPIRAPEPTLQAPMRADLLDTSAVLEALRGAASRDDVVVAALRGLRTVGRRAAIFVVRRDGFHGWACNVELGDLEKLRAVSVPSDAPSLFATAVAAGSYFGPVPSNAAHAALLAVLEQPSSDVAVAVARAGGKPVMLLFADDLVDVKRRVLPRLLEIADAVGASLSRLLAARL